MDISLNIIECVGRQGFVEARSAKHLCRATRSDEKIWISTKNLYQSRNPLMFAAFKKDLSRLRYLTSLDYLIDQVCSRGFTALFWAISGGCIECVRFLISKGANMYITCKKFYSPLILAIKLNRIDIVELMIQSGLVSFQGSLNAAFALGLTDLALFLIRAGATFDCINVCAPRKKKFDSTLMWAIKETACNHDDTNLSEFLYKGLLFEEWVNYSRADGTNPLMLACYYNHCEAIKILLKNGSLDSQRPKDGMSGLLWASKRGNMDAIKILLKHNFNINISFRGRNALFYAIESGNVRLVLFLCMNGINLTNSLSFVIYNYGPHSLELTNILLHFGAIPNLKDIKKFMFFDENIIELFLDYGVLDSNFRIEGRSLLELSISRNYSDLKLCLLKKMELNTLNDYSGCLNALIRKPNFFDQTCEDIDVFKMICGRTTQEERTKAFQCAILEEKPHLLELICSYGANIDSSFSDGMKPLMIACSFNNAELVKVLIKLGLSDIHNFEDPRTRTIYSSVSMLCDKSDLRGLECLEVLKSHGFFVI